jgi:glycogen debranching enzyme
MGGSVFNDGIAAYPEPIYEPGNFSGGVQDHKNSFKIKCLSTNCVYRGAYLALANMSRILVMNKEVSATYQKKADDIKSNILKYLYNKETNTFSYLIDQNGKAHQYQEGLGISFAVIFGVIDGEKATQLISNAVVSKFGITSINPDFPRYSIDMPGRHNNIIWPMVNGFYAKAAILSESYQTFTHELFGLTRLALDEDKGDYDFREIYNPTTGKPDGGYQAWGAEHPNYHWDSCKLQTWSATAYISMVLNGLFGMNFTEQSLSFTPYLPKGISRVELKDIVYRNSTLDISVKGNGNTIKSFTLDGKIQPNHSIASTLKGSHYVTIEVK